MGEHLGIFVYGVGSSFSLSRVQIAHHDKCVNREPQYEEPQLFQGKPALISTKSKVFVAHLSPSPAWQVAMLVAWAVS